MSLTDLIEVDDETDERFDTFDMAMTTQYGDKRLSELFDDAEDEDDQIFVTRALSRH